ncbi:MAG: 1-deoxy-D-xylulose-5-phosphate reductoisomerase [Clostridia bacterium]|nr:1-deoxy-D-xylulose-5-phosphate reductoisomerase [Clostridia bacterium]
MKKISILGSTGSIGTQSLDIIEKNPDKFKIVALACGKRVEVLAEQIKKFKPELVSVGDEKGAEKIRNEFPGLAVYSGKEGLIKVASSDCDIVINSLMGIAGLEPTYRAVEAGKDIALANKETLVTGGHLITKLVSEKGVKLLPVDSEHSAIFQCLEGNKGRKIKRILLTCSGGPFRTYSLEDLEKVTVADALKHPKWNMGKKITIDSASQMNKGLEVIEAKWLFDVDVDDIQVLVHPQSIVHSAVEFEDTSVIAQMGVPDMRIPISLAIGYPNRIPSDEPSLDFFKEGSNLTFEEPRMDVFKCIKLAYDAQRQGGSYPVVLNGANEVLVDLFLREKIRFIDIQNNLEKILENHHPEFNLSLEDVLRVDKDIRQETLKMLDL